MSVNVLFAALPMRWAQYEAPLRAAFEKAGVSVNLIGGDTSYDPAQIDYIIYAPNSDVQDFAPFTRCKAVLALWAGVEDVVGNASLTQPLARMVDYGLTEGMVEWCVGHVMRHHLGIDAHIHGQDGVWRAGIIPPLARDRVITLLGMGELGCAVAQALAGLRFQVRGWSRSPKTVEGVTTFAGADGLHEALSGADGVVLLLPNTPATGNTLDAAAMAMMKPGAFVVNPGRGPLVDDAALVEALDAGQIGHATLDVFRVEPLPQDHPFWAHPGVTVTPHIASETRASSAAEVIAENVRRGEAGEGFLHLVDRAAGY
jgi:glyoxylate/hydroxypyruvate reductase A